MLYRWFTARCMYCGNKKRHYDIWGGFVSCPTDMGEKFQGYTNMGCYTKKKFIRHKEAKVQRALGLLSGPKGMDI